MSLGLYCVYGLITSKPGSAKSFAGGIEGCAYRNSHSQRQTNNAQWVRVGFTTLQHCAVVSGTDANVFATVRI